MSAADPSLTQVTVDSPVGGIMTDEVGAITGTVVIAVTTATAGTAVSVAYEGSADTYTVTGSPAASQHPAEQIVAHLTRDPGENADGNARSTSLADLPA